MKTVKLGPWVTGMVNKVDAHSVPADALVAASNCDVDVDGYVTSRKKWGQLDSSKQYTCLFEHGNTTYAVAGGSVGVVTETAFTPIRAVQQAISWAVVNDYPVYCDYDGVYRVIDLSAEKLTVDAVEGDERYDVVPMPGGSIVEYWQGRLLVVRGSTLVWSEPLRYGATSAMRNFIRFPEKIQWIAPLPSGVFVGLINSVRWLAGSDPAKFIQQPVGETSAPGVAGVVDARFFDEKLTRGADTVAVWFTDVGFAVGLPDGSVVYPQADRLKNLPLLPGKLVVDNDRIIVYTTKE